MHVVSGLRRYSEPGSAQILIAIGSIIISIAAFALSAAAFYPTIRIGILVAGVPYVALAIYGIGLATNVDERRKTAMVWLKAIEARIR